MTRDTFSYTSGEKEPVLCNLCDKDTFAVIAVRAKDREAVRTCLCRNCGLVYISPRMTRAAYDEYYKYHYRDDREAIKGKLSEPEYLNFEHARTLGRALGRRLEKYIAPEGLTIDVGSSTGGVLKGLKDVFPNIQPLGIEPSVTESKHANDNGIPTQTCLFEDFDSSGLPSASTILCVQSLNHLLDPLGFVKWSAGLLKDRGHLVLMVKNFRHQARRAGSVEAGVQIDHPYMFTPETLKAFCESAGLEVVFIDNDEYKSHEEIRRQKKEGVSGGHIRLVARKVEGRSSGRDPRLRRTAYLRLRFQFLKPYLKLYYLIHYSRRLSFLRALLYS